MAALIARGSSESDAKARVEQVIADNPSLEERRSPAASGEREARFSSRDTKLLSAWEMSEGFGVIRQEKPLGGHRGPEEGYTCPGIASRVTAQHPWFASHPKWWEESYVPMIRIVGKVVPLRVVGFLNLASLVSESTRPLTLAA
ncbi:hypothetical protein GCM10010140_11990 [Streptosporangium pseudovulgare]|uniref:Uncharacterized protein n=1 Tax=Streptosporangium pseudovulgare TaxID=35765 RepID=A0ABQ2QJH7_9ACTN|nr:hypothetical protein GCM10010140_11990 [Streptosporangium pseudovulgare]